MKKITLVLLASSLLCLHSIGQDTLRYPAIDTSILKRTYSIVAIDNHHQNVMGYLAAVNDTSIMISSTKIHFNPRDIVSPEWQKIKPENLVKVSIVSKGVLGRSILTGAIIGVVGGALLGALGHSAAPTISTPNEPAMTIDPGIGGDVAAGATIGLVSGAVIGALVGVLAKKTFIIHGKRENYERMRRKMVDRVYKF